MSDMLQEIRIKCSTRSVDMNLARPFKAGETSSKNTRRVATSDMGRNSIVATRRTQVTPWSRPWKAGLNSNDATRRILEQTLPQLVGWPGKLKRSCAFGSYYSCSLTL